MTLVEITTNLGLFGGRDLFMTVSMVNKCIV